ncbi:MAG: pentapeptide repeat-containing protein [Rhodospirillales bacterium]
MNKEPLNPIPWILGGLALLIVCAGFFNSEYASFDYWRDMEDGASRSEVVRNLGLLAVAVLGVIFAILRWHNLNRQAATAERQADTANKQRALAERGLITDRFSKAAEHLGSAEILIRLGGIYTLWRLIEEIPGRDEDARRRDVEMILNILTSFVRHDEEGRVTQDEDGRTVLRIDVETIIHLLGYPRAPYRSIMPTDHKLDFRGANLSGAQLGVCDFHNANFFTANLSDAVLIDTNLSEAFLAYAKFNGANMHRAILTDADLSGADFTGAIGMTQEQIDSALWDKKYPLMLPKGLTPPPQKPKEEE